MLDYGKKASLAMSTKTSLPSNLSPHHARAHAADTYRQLAPPPQLPSVQLSSRHQDPAIDRQDRLVANDYNPNGQSIGVVRCHEGRGWQERGRHASERLGRFSETEIDSFVVDLALVLRREYDCWVEQCWHEAFHHVFTRTVPDLIINLIATGATPIFLRKNIIFGGQSLDHLFESQMLHMLFEELERRLSGSRPQSALRSSSVLQQPLLNTVRNSFPLSSSTNQLAPNCRDGVCFHNLACYHGIPEEEDDHGLCLCHLTTCMSCFHHFALNRRGPISRLPYEVLDTPAVDGWLGEVESEAHARARLESLRRKYPSQTSLPTGKGFAHVPKETSPQKKDSVKLPQIFPHPQMTDVLAVEENLRWRLNKLGAPDPAIESRYGPCSNNPIALEGLNILPTSPDLHAETNSSPSTNPRKNMRVTKVRGKGKNRRVTIQNGTPAMGANIEDKGKVPISGAAEKKVLLPDEWIESDPGERNTAVVLTFRHFVKLLHQIAIAACPFSYPDYRHDIPEFQKMHPVALYRRLVEPVLERRASQLDSSLSVIGGKGGRNGKIDTLAEKELHAWRSCMDKWAEEFGGKERKKGNDQSSEKNHSFAIIYYTRAISLDPKKTVYYSNRAIAFNQAGLRLHAEADCTYLLQKDPKNQKALYQRALARRGMGRFEEAEDDLEELLKLSEDNESARALLNMIQAEAHRSDEEIARDYSTD
ncbi:hypothetical protein L204_101813 [Cryptococcus depauperatus]